MPLITSSPIVATSAQIAPGAVLGSDIANDTVLDANIGAHTTSKITVPTTLLSGTVSLAQLAAKTQGSLLIYGASGAPTELPQSTSGFFLKTQGASANPVWAAVPNPSIFKNGQTTYASNNASSAITMAHGCGIAPVKVRLNCVACYSGTPIAEISMGSWDSGGQSCCYMCMDSSWLMGTDSTHAIFMQGASGNTQAGIVTVDATNITITWTKAGNGGLGGSGLNFQIQWEAYA